MNRSVSAHSHQPSAGGRGIRVGNPFQTATAAFAPDVVRGILDIARPADHSPGLCRSGIRWSLLLTQRRSTVRAERGTIQTNCAAMRTLLLPLELASNVRRGILLQLIDLCPEFVFTLFDRSNRRHLSRVCIQKLLVAGFAIQYAHTEFRESLRFLLCQCRQFVTAAHDLRFLIRIGDSAIDGFSDVIQKNCLPLDSSILSLSRPLVEEYVIRDFGPSETRIAGNKFVQTLRKLV